jgi:hypothetical protein
MFLLNRFSRYLPVLQVSNMLGLILAGFLIISMQHSAEAAGTLISAPARVDMVYDSSRDIVYITNAGSILQYKIGSNTFLPSFDLGGSLGGIDLSPDGNTLVVADRQRSESEVWIYLVDLQTGLSRKVTFPRTFGEGGTFTAVFGNDGAVLVTSTFEGSGWVPMRRYDPTTGTTTQIASSVRQNTMLTGSSDGSTIGFAESNISDGPFGRYRVLDGNLLRKSGYTDGTSWFNYEIGVNRNGTQYAIPTYGGTYFYDADLKKIGAVGQYAGPQPIGVVYHPAEDIVYFAWSGSAEVRAFDTTSYAQLSAYDFEYNFTNPGNNAFVQGRLKMSRDGSLLLATVAGGIRYLRLYDPLVANEQTVVTDENKPAAITLQGIVGNGGNLSYSIETNPTHGTLSGTAPNLTYTPDTDYFGTDSFAFKVTYGAASSVAKVSISINRVNNLPVANNQLVTTNEDTVTNITLSASDIDHDVLTYTVVNAPAHGTLSGIAPNLIYTPAANYNGTDSFSFKANDGTADSNIATVSIVIAPVNDRPIAVADSKIMLRNTTANIAVLSNDRDVDGDTLTVIAVSRSVRGGRIAIKAGGTGISYTPPRNYTGRDTFTYTVSDGKGGTATATVTVTILRWF